MESTMTYTYKVLSLMLLIGATMGGTFAKKSSHSSDSCDDSRKHKPCPVKEDPFKCCDKLCCADLCNTDCTIECGKKCAQLLCFETGLSYQALITNENGTPPSQALAPKGVCGKLQICFDELMTQICYRITICGAASTGNANTQVMGAFLYINNACQVINSNTESIIFVPLVPLSPVGSCGTETDPLCVTGTITMEDLEAAGGFSAPFRSIACIYAQAIANNLSIQVFGSNCVEDTPFDQGLLRGTLRPCYPTCHSRD